MGFRNKTLKIGDFAQVKGGKRMPAGTALSLNKSNHPYLRIVDFKDDGIECSNLQYVPDDVFPTISKYVISKNDVYISIVGTIGLVGSIPQHLDGANLTENAAKIENIDPQKIDRKYLEYFLRSSAGQRIIHKLTVGSTQPKLALFRIKQIEVPCPPLYEQRQISDILSELDNRITFLRETNAILESIAQTLFKSWFVNFDPVHAKQQDRALDGMDAETAALFPDGFEMSELGEIPKGWKVGVLGDFTKIVKKQIKASELNDELNYIGLEHIPRKSLSIVEWGTAKGLGSSKTMFNDGDILFGKLRPYFHKVVIAPMDGICSTDILVCQSKKPAYFGFVVMNLFSTTLIEYANRVSNGAKMPRVGWKDIAAYSVVVPPSALISKYTKVVEPMLSSIKFNALRVKTLANLRDTLLPRLISGQLRINSDSIDLGEAA